MRLGIIGAGMAGLMAGQALQQHGHDVVLIDKGRSPGGRLATRRIHDATLDHGAQFFTVRSDRFAEHVERWRRVGLITEWCRGFGEQDGYPRYIVAGGMNALARHLAFGLDIRCSTMAFVVEPGASGGWDVVVDDATRIAVDGLIVTTPLPQAFALLISSGVTLPEALTTMEYDRTIALLTVLDRSGTVPDPGGVQNPDEVFGFIGDNAAKGVSTTPAITFHANSAWSDAHWDDPHEVLDTALRAAARPWLGDASIVTSQIKKWRFATPRTPWPESCWAAPTPSDVASSQDVPARQAASTPVATTSAPRLLTGDGQAFSIGRSGGPPAPMVRAPLVLAGDAFAGPRIEGAALSGLAAADVFGRSIPVSRSAGASTPSDAESAGDSR